jgi:hypothetical protein
MASPTIDQYLNVDKGRRTMGADSAEIGGKVAHGTRFAVAKNVSIGRRDGFQDNGVRLRHRTHVADRARPGSDTAP